jgi:adenosylmethionine-8-amino-7-oxononanoate aminotransferase
MTYVVLEAATGRKLEEIVTKALNAGYSPVGGVSVSESAVVVETSNGPDIQHTATYAQAMIATD